MILEHTEYFCTNKECQEEFEKGMLVEAEKKEKIRMIRLADAEKRSSVKNTL